MYWRLIGDLVGNFWGIRMAYIYGDHPTKGEVIATHKGGEKPDVLWLGMQRNWRAKAEIVPLRSKGGNHFWFVITPYLLGLITKISEQRGFLDALSLPHSLQKKLEEKAVNYEAYYSSHIEGAKSSLKEALRFIKKKQKYSPDESLQMIKNNQRALEYAMKQINKPVSDDLICKLQYILTKNTHKSHPITVGKYRRGPVYIVNGLGQVIYEGPPHEKGVIRN